MPPQGMPPQGMPPQGMPPQGMPPQGMPPQRMYPHGMPHHGMPHHGMPPQGMPPQGMPPQGMSPQKMNPQINSNEGSNKDKDIINSDKIEESISDKIKQEFKLPLIVVILTFIFILPQSNVIFKLIPSTLLINETGMITTTAIFIKALLVGILYYIAKSYT
ncbi:MAG: hypothetical protein CMG46_02605 [Candidatus Marinimicrobia bacterium]|nr:hypothetical protein [Candidatus Neomarinimicrobiota bacterium]